MLLVMPIYTGDVLSTYIGLGVGGIELGELEK